MRLTIGGRPKRNRPFLALPTGDATLKAKTFYRADLALQWARKVADLHRVEVEIYRREQGRGRGRKQFRKVRCVPPKPVRRTRGSVAV